MGFPNGSAVKNTPARQMTQQMQIPPRVGKIPWRRKWQPTPVFLPRESHGQRSLAGYSPKVHKESDTTEQRNTHSFLWPHWGLAAVCGLSRVAASRGHSLVAGYRLLIAVASLVAECGSRHKGSVLVANRPSCSEADEIFPDQGSNPCSPHWQADS